MYLSFFQSAWKFLLGVFDFEIGSKIQTSHIKITMYWNMQKPGIKRVPFQCRDFCRFFFSFPVNDSYLTRVHSVRDWNQKKDWFRMFFRTVHGVTSAMSLNLKNIRWNYSAMGHSFPDMSGYMDFHYTISSFFTLCALWRRNVFSNQFALVWGNSALALSHQYSPTNANLTIVTL